MRIFITVPSMNVTGGIERVVSIQVNYWVKHFHHEVFIITDSNRECNSFFKLSPEVSIIDISKPEHLVSKYNLIKKVKSFNYYKQSLSGLIAKYRPDVIFTTLHNNDVFVWPSICGDIPIVAVNHVSMYMRRGDFTRGFINKIYCYIVYLLLCHNLKKFSAVIALSKIDSLWLKRINTKSLYIPNPINYSNDLPLTTLRKKQVICLGRLDFLKGQDRLIEIWSHVVNNFPEWTLIFVGDGIAKDKLVQQVNSLHLHDSVIFTGVRTDIRNLLSSSSIFAFTSRTESFGMSILEAFTCGLPVVSYDCPTGPADLVHSYFNGFLIEDGNSTEFINKLSLLMSNATLRKSLGDNARMYSQRFSTENVMMMYEDLLNNL